jgi:acryloyl-coenzyme A reductase
MKAVVFYEHGGPEVLRYEEVETPTPGDGEVLIEVEAVSINPGPDTETRRRGFGMGAIEMPHIGGVDPAGKVTALGAGVGGVALGDRVAVYPVIACGRCDFCLAGKGENYCRESRLFGVQTKGGRADYVCAPASQLVALPGSVSSRAAAALGVAYTTTWHGMVERAKTTEADTVLVMGAGGGCGVAAVQIGKLLGARVLAVTGAEWKRERVAELGADEVFSYYDEDWPEQVKAATDGRGVSVLFDNVGASTLAASIDCLDRCGRLFCSGGTTGLEVNLDLRRLYRDHLSLLFYVQGTKADMETLVGLVAEGKLDPVIDEEIPLSNAARADERLAAGEQFGRIVLVNGRDA